LENFVKRKPRLLHIVFLITLLVSLLLPVTALAGENPPGTPTDDEVNAIARQLFCPVCENVPLDVCETQACAQWRELIREQLADGWSEDEIKQYFVDHYGARVLSEPPAEGFNWLAYIVPPVAFLLGAFFLYRGFKIWRQVDADAPADADSQSEAARAPDSPAAEPEDAYMARLEEELKSREA
jgi:cytochrome c-type biogenesis protein CcmH